MPLSDLFIKVIDLEKGSITYDVRDKDTGKLLEPTRTGKLEVIEETVYFDRFFLPATQVFQLSKTLTS